MASDAEHLFMSLGPLYVFLGEVSAQVFWPFFNWVVCLPGVESCKKGPETYEKMLSITSHQRDAN